MNELIIRSKQVAIIEWDKEKALQDANAIMQKYEGLVLEEEDLKDAKKELATLRKVSKEINNQALEIDKELTANVKKFRDEVKQVQAIVNNGINHIDAQVKEFEQRIKLERKNEIMSWEEYESISEYVPFNDDWLLKKWSDDSLKELLQSHKDQLNTYIATIKMTSNTLGLNSEFYIDKLKTIAYAQVIERMNEDAKNLTHKEEVQEVVIDKTEELITFTCNMKGTKSQIIAMKEYANKIGVELTR